MLSHFANIEERDQELFKAMKMLNKVRNGIAHSLNINIQLVKEFIAQIEHHSDNDKAFVDDDLIEHRFLVAIGYLSGIIFMKFEKLRSYEN